MTPDHHNPRPGRTIAAQFGMVLIVGAFVLPKKAITPSDAGTGK